MLAQAGMTHKRTRPYRPQTNGEVERFNRTLLDEWAYVQPYRTEQEGRDAYPAWLHAYNHHRGHRAQGTATRASRVPNSRVIHLACEQGQKPLAILITAAQRGDSPLFTAVLEAIRVPCDGPGRPRSRPDKVRADKAYGSRANRAYLRRRKIQCTIPAKKVANRTKLRSHGGRPPKFDKVDCRERHAVERCKPPCCHIRGSVPLPSSPSGRASGAVSVVGWRPR